MKHSTKTPSKYMALDLLQKIKANNYRGADGKDYTAHDVDDLIHQKSVKVSDAKNQEYFAAHRQIEAWRCKLLKKIKAMRLVIDGMEQQLAIQCVMSMRSEVVECSNAIASM